MSRRRFAAAPASVAATRHFVEALLAGCDASVRERAVLLASELATNAVAHAGGDFVVEVRVESAEIFLAVRDTSAARPRRRSPGPTDPGGRGLQIVDALADEWGVDDHRDGKTVWCRLMAPRRSRSRR